MLGYLLCNRKVWGLTIGFAAYGYSFYLFLTWLPNYLVETMHMSILKSAGFSAIPWICATIADLVAGGSLIDHLIARGYDETPVRKTVLVLGMLLGLAVFGATLTTSPVWAVVWISIALSGLAAAAPVGWSIPSLIAPRRDRHYRRDHEFFEQPHGRRSTRDDRLHRRSYALLHRRISDSWRRAGRRHHRLRLPPGPAGTDRGSASHKSCEFCVGSQPMSDDAQTSIVLHFQGLSPAPKDEADLECLEPGRGSGTCHAPTLSRRMPSRISRRAESAASREVLNI